MNLPISLLAAGALLLLVATPVLGVFTWRAWGRERHVPRDQVPARVIQKHTPGLSGVFQARFSPRYHYELEVEYPGPGGQMLIGKVKVDNAPTIARPEPFDGTVWVSQLDPRDISVEPTGRKERSFRLVILTGLCLAAGFALVVYGGIEYVSTWFEQNVVD